MEESVDCFPAPAEDLVYLFIPHEYTALVDHLAQPTPEQMRRTVAICTEQPGTGWFEKTHEVAARAGAVVDINMLGALELNRRGVPAEHVQIGYVPAWDAWGGDQTRERPIDMAFLGRHTEGRARTIARCAPVLERRRAAIHLTETFRPHVASASYFLSAPRRSRLLADSKVLLNVHQQDLPYLEWHRVLSAVLNGCVVLSEHSLQTLPFEAGTHFVSAGVADLPQVLDALLADPARLTAIRNAAYGLVRERMPMAGAADVLLRAIRRVAEAPAPSLSQGPPPVPMPQELPEPKPGWEAHVEQMGHLLPVRRALMDLVVRTRGLERRIEELSDDRDGSNRIEVEELGPGLESPRISVLLTVYNHAKLVGDAVRSVALGDERDVEVVAVDDGSTDGSGDAVRAACAEAPWLTARLVRCSSNSGLPAVARNLAAEHARGDLFFVLDADNLVMPQGLTKLLVALDRDPHAAFAYGILQRFNVEGAQALESWLDWDPKRLRHGNFVDAMALIRRPAWEAVGGHPTQRTLVGWEDFAFWVAMADTGLRGVRVPDFVGRYRVSQHSTVSLANIDHSEAWSAMVREYPVLAGSTAPAT